MTGKPIFALSFNKAWCERRQRRGKDRRINTLPPKKQQIRQKVSFV